MTRTTLIDKITDSISASALKKRLLKHVLSSFETSYGDTQDKYDYFKTKPDPRAVKYLDERIIILSDKTADRLKGNLKYELVEGMKNTESITDIKQRLKPIFDDMKDYELERLARTEVMDAMNEGRLEAYREDGDVRYKVWKAALNNSRTADDSKRLAGQVQPLGAQFVDPETGKTCDHPPNRPNCRCGTVPLEELPDDIVYRGDLMYYPRYMYGTGGTAAPHKPKEAKPEESTKLIAYKEKLSKMDISDLKSEAGNIGKEYPSVETSMRGWYRGSEIGGVDPQLTSVFDMPPDSSRDPESVTVDPVDAEGYKKIYAVSQEYLSRTNPSGEVTVYRGLGEKTYHNFKHLEPGASADVTQYNVSSWSTDMSVAQSFAEGDGYGGVVIETRIPAQRVFVHPDCALSSGGILPGEKEVIVMESDIKATMVEFFVPDEDAVKARDEANANW